MSYRNVLRDSGKRDIELTVNVCACAAHLQPPLKCHPHLHPHSRLTLYTLAPGLALLRPHPAHTCSSSLTSDPHYLIFIPR